jgi:ectoine hydroxylase-related dioxygenase (phytanoyl-CoA dioxygenase family)
MSFVELSEEQKSEYRTKGYIILRSLFTSEEIEFLRTVAEQDLKQETVMTKPDLEGGKISLKMWNHAGDDIYGLLARNERVVDIVELLLDQEVYLYSAKMILKNAREGGAWEWHQDYGYWHNYGCLFPWMLSCLIAVDRATRENGCLQLLEGSHQIGRVDHFRVNEQTIADRERVEVACNLFPLVYVELEPGDAVFFDCNVLHRSDANRSANQRWNYICSYNAVANKPYKRVRDYGNYEPLVKAPAGAIQKLATEALGQTSR